MAARMFRDDFQTRANREPQQGNEGILVANVVYIVAACLPHQRSGGFGAPKKTLHNARFHLPGGFYLLGYLGALSSRVWSNVRANEPAAEPAESYFLDRSMWLAFQGCRKQRHQDFIPSPEVLEALSDTPRTLTGLPVELGGVQSCCHRLGTPIGGVQFTEKAQRPLRQT